MRVHIGADHAGYDLKTHLVEWLTANGHEPVDHGAHEDDPADDYPPFCIAAAEAVVAEPGSLAIVIGGSGNGEQIAANKVRGTRVGLAWNIETARLTREHNDANLVGIGARQHTLDEATAIVEAFLTTPFSGNERHARRIAQVAAYEESGILPELP